MASASVEKSLDLLRQVLDGRTFGEVGETTGLSRAAVEKRVKAIDREVRATVGVVGAPDDGSMSAREMRRLREAYLEAIEHYRPRKQDRQHDHRMLTDGELEHAVETARRRSRCPNRDVALLYLLFATGAKPLEIARLRVGDYLNRDGSVRVESRIAEDVAVSGKARPLFFASTKLVGAIDAYLKERVQQGHGVSDDSHYRGLDPSSRLFLTEDGTPMAVVVKSDGEHRRQVCGSILDIYRKLFERAGLRGVSTLAARRMVAMRLHDRGCDLAQIGEALGIRDRDSIRRLIPRARGPLRDLFRDLV